MLGLILAFPWLAVFALMLTGGIILFSIPGEALGMRGYGRLFAPCAACVGLIMLLAGSRWGLIPLVFGTLVTFANLVTSDYHPRDRRHSDEQENE